MMSEQNLSVDLIIIGGGIAGLWLLNRACNAGYNAILFEQHALGNEQTIASQGMIHGGIKYALSGALSGSSEAIADMPDHWRRCLKGEGDVDLRAAKVLSEHFFLWSSQSIGSRMTSFFASKLTRGRVDKVKADRRPAVFDSPQFKGSLYKLVDVVLDVPTVLQALYDNYSDRIFEIDWSTAQFIKGDASVQGIQIDGLTITADQFVFSAGKGNQDLMAMIGADQPAMQIRPLQQVIFTHDYHQPIYAHCLGMNPTPRLTISSHKSSNPQGKAVWYLGGDLATDGINDSPEKLIAKAKIEIGDLFPWIYFGETSWATLPVDRAEPKQKGLVKPDKAFAAKASGYKNVTVAWPTKLTLAPNMADEVLALLPEAKEKNAPADLTLLSSLAKPGFAKVHW